MGNAESSWIRSFNNTEEKNIIEYFSGETKVNGTLNRQKQKVFQMYS